MTVMAPVKTLSSRDFNQNTGEAKRAADKGPVYITDRGEPAYVLLSYVEYRKLTGKEMSLAEALEQKGGPELDFEFPEYPRKRRLQPPDLS